MGAIPTWRAATIGQRGDAGLVNQFIGAHNASFVYAGSLISSQTTGAAAYASTQGTWQSQTITTGSSQTGIGYIQIQLSTVGGSPTLPLISPITVALYADNGLGLPTGSALASVTVSNSYVYNSPFWVTIQLFASGLTASTKYHIVTKSVGTSTNYYAWQKSNQISGAATSTDGVTWTAQSYGLMYQVYDVSTSGSGPVMAIYEDGGSRVTQFTYNANGSLATVYTYVVGQTSTAYVESTRSLTYSNGLLTVVS